jgi:hypothetical protein
MPKGKLIRGLAALLMILALVLPVSPGLAAEEIDDGQVQAAHLPGGPGALGTPGGASGIGVATADATGVTPVPTNFATYDRADCPLQGENTAPNGAIGRARYVVTVDTGTGTNTAAGVTVQLIGTGSANLGQIVPMTNGDLDNQANDGVPCYFSFNCLSGFLGNGQPFTAQDILAHQTCGLTADLQPTPPDGHANDFASPFVNSHNPTNYGNSANPTFGAAGSTNAADTWTWDILIQGVGAPRRYNLSLVTDNRAGCTVPLGAGGCPVGPPTSYANGIVPIAPTRTARAP